ncbi:MAG: tol-pal system protein YbgF [Candidatus Cloacimonetes bacterium]|nr:tol-pal system protein YbgF [Candidatus Cloacimonadota bacterium]
MKNGVLFTILLCLSLLQALSTTEIYEASRHLYEKGNFEAAERNFRDFIEQYPQDPLVVNAHYWQAECLYAQEDFTAALKVFQGIVDFYPETPKAPDAQIKIAKCYDKLGQKKQALLEMKRVAKEYPDYPYMNKVNRFIRELK